jgi:hypothetical protein
VQTTDPRKYKGTYAGTDEFEEYAEFRSPIHEVDMSWHESPPTPNGFRIKSKKRGSNFTKPKKKR